MKLRGLVEGQIRKAQLAGDLDNLKGAGKPLPRNADTSTEAVGYRLMSAAGAVPEEIRLRKAVSVQVQVLAQTTDPAARKVEMAKLADLQMRLSIAEEARRKFARQG